MDTTTLRDAIKHLRFASEQAEVALKDRDYEEVEAALANGEEALGMLRRVLEGDK